MPEDKLPPMNIPVSKAYRYRQHIKEMIAWGSWYITNCQPQSIPAECNRLDCPMRQLALPPEADEDDYLMECDPPGFLADLLIMVQSTAAPLPPTRFTADDVIGQDDDSEAGQ